MPTSSVAILITAVTAGVVAATSPLLASAIAVALLVLALLSASSRAVHSLLIAYVALNFLGPPIALPGGVTLEPADIAGAGLLLVALTVCRRETGNSVTRAAWAIGAVALASSPILLLTAPAIFSTSVLRALRLLFVGAAATVACYEGSKERELAQDVARMVVVAGTLGSAFGLWAVLSGFTPPWPSAGQQLYLPTGVAHRAVGLVGESSTFGLLALMVFAMASLGHRTLRLAPGTRYLAVSVSLGAMIASFSRATAVGLILLLVMQGVLTGKWTRNVGVLLAAGCIAAALVLWVPFLHAGVESRLTQSLSPEGTNGVLSGRLTTWHHAFSSILDAPKFLVTGHGFKSFGTLLGTPATPVYGDDNYLTLLFESGVLGLGLVCAAWAVMIRRLARGATDLASAVAAFAIALILVAVVADVFTYSRVLGPLWILAAINASQSVRQVRLPEARGVRLNDRHVLGHVAFREHRAHDHAVR